MSGCEAVLAGLEGELAWIRDTYMDLHRHPELSLEEHGTSRVVEGKLAAFGYAVARIGGTGVVGILANGDGPTVLARADMDALPVTEATGLSYASAVDGVMHACGHDLHVAALLGAAKLMADGRTAWSGTYIALFQPGEEIGAGSQAMLDDGLVAKVPRPDVAFAQHVMPIPAGTVATTPGPVLSAADSLKITVYGKGAHGSMPHMSVDPWCLPPRSCSGCSPSSRGRRNRATSRLSQWGRSTPGRRPTSSPTAPHSCSTSALTIPRSARPSSRPLSG